MDKNSIIGWVLIAVSIYNVYNNMNPFLLYQDEGSMYKVSIFPLLPSVSYTFKF